MRNFTMEYWLVALFYYIISWSYLSFPYICFHGSVCTKAIEMCGMNLVVKVKNNTYVNIDIYGRHSLNFQYCERAPHTDIYKDLINKYFLQYDPYGPLIWNQAEKESLKQKFTLVHNPPRPTQVPSYIFPTKSTNSNVLFFPDSG